MKIIGLEADGFRRLTAVEMEFKDKGLIPIYGKNKQGKSTILDFVLWMINGNKELNPDIISWDKDKMKGKLRLGDYEIEREYSRKSAPKLKVKNVLTGEYEKGEVQIFLSTFINELTMNPRPFIDLNTLGKMKFLMDLLGIDFTAINKQMEALEQDRLLCGREVKKFGDLDESKPEKAERVDVQKLLDERKAIESRNQKLSEEAREEEKRELEKIEQFNKEQREQARAIETEQNRMNDLVEEKNDIEATIESLKRQLAEKEELLQENKKDIDDCQKCLDHLNLHKPEPEKSLTFTSEKHLEYESTSEIDKQIQEANAVNVKADAYDKWQEKKKEKAEKEKEYDSYDSKIKNLREEKLRILRETNTGVEGLEIREDGLYYNNAHSDNWSDSESLRIASELCLAQINREKQIEAIFLDRFESFDKEMRESFNSWCEEKGIQAVVTIVRDSKEMVDDESPYFFIEAGEVEYHGEEVVK